MPWAARLKSSQPNLHDQQRSLEAITMEPGTQTGSRTDHDRDYGVNGVNGTGAVSAAPDQDKTAATKDSGPVNGTGASDRGRGPASPAPPPRMNDLPDVIVHITHGFVPLSLLLTRLAQVTHNSLQDKISELAKLPLPASAVNGNSTLVPGGGPDDSSSENLRKKGNLASFAQDLHGKWLKALVVTEWSRKSEMVSKLIDLKFHIDQQRILYDASLDNIINVKRDLTYARMPSPDLKMALQILSTGKAPWMPDLNYLDPAPLTPSEQLKWMNDLNTLLSLRLNVEDFDKIPYHFRNYEFGSGRVTFKVDGEFEVDLTIADEDFEKQFWFIDFRYAFQPAAASLPESLRTYLEGCVNEALNKEGLAGCYRFLHEFVLTSKINELKRQAIQLSRNAWTGTLVAEPLNRALAIQYWTSRAATTGTKSWILVAVNSGRPPNGKTDPKATSSIVAKWYRDNKEVKDVALKLDAKHVSAESLLTNVIGRHIEFILTGIHDKLLSPRFKNMEASMVLDVSKSDPAASSLSIQVGYRESATLMLESMAGVFAIKPQSKFTVQPEHHLNNGKHAAEDGAACLENVRCAVVEDELHRRGSSMGWFSRKSPLTLEETKSVTKLRNWSRATWLQKGGWGASWFIVVFLGLGGDEWWLVETCVPSPASRLVVDADQTARNRGETNRAVRFKARLPLHKGYPDQSEAFWNDLALFTTGIIVQSVDIRELHRHRIKSRASDSMNPSFSQHVRLPSIEVSLSALFPSMISPLDATDVTAGCSRPGDLAADDTHVFSLMQRYTGAALASKQPWADNMVLIKFKGIQALPATDEGTDDSVGELICVSDAIIKVRRPAMFAALKGVVDHDVSYNARLGEFSLRIRRSVAEPVFGALKTRIKAIDRFVNYFEAVTGARGTIATESMSLKRVTFCYGAAPAPAGEKDDMPRPWRVSLDLSDDEIEVEMKKGNPHLRVLDLARKLVNSHGGIGALMTWLPLSLSILTTIAELQTRWDDVEAQGQGRFDCTMKAVGWITIAYSSVGPGAARQKRAVVELRMKLRREEPWWHAWRSDAPPAGAPRDDFGEALRPVWAAKGDGWLGLATSAAGRPGGGVEAMLRAIDDAVLAVLVAPAKQGHAHDVVVLD